MLKSRIHFLRRKQFVSKPVSNKKSNALFFSSAAVTAIFIQNISLWKISKRSPRAVTDIATLFSASLTTRNRSKLSRNVFEKRDSSRTWSVFSILTEPTYLNLSGRALVSSICADSWSIRYIHNPRFRFSELPSVGFSKKPRGYILREDRPGAASLSVSFLETVLSYRHYWDSWDKRHSGDKCSPRRHDKSLSLRFRDFSWDFGSTCPHSRRSRE